MGNNASENREFLREKGQFWTPDWVAEAMVAYASDTHNEIFDPACGTGAFSKALVELHMIEQGFVFRGMDIDSNVVHEGYEKGNYSESFTRVTIDDFILRPPSRKFSSIVANPPYIRHHRLSADYKTKLRKISRHTLGLQLDGRTGLHVYFLIQALNLLEDGGKLAFIVSADVCEGIFARDLWTWITQNFCLESIITFTPNATPFPQVDINPIILFIKKAVQREHLLWVQCSQPFTPELRYFAQNVHAYVDLSLQHLSVSSRNTNEALRTGLSRPPRASVSRYTLKDFAYVMRGIATGHNDFFYLTTERAVSLGLPEEFLKLAVGRTRDIKGEILTKKQISHLQKKGRPTLLFSPDGRHLNQFTPKVRQYLQLGEKMGLNLKALIKTRKPWYKMERREVPHYLFAYLGRRNSRFINNQARALPLTSFLCVYSIQKNRSYVNRLWSILSDQETLANIKYVGKSYGSGAIKVEPRSLENLPIPEHLVEKFQLAPFALFSTF